MKKLALFGLMAMSIVLAGCSGKTNNPDNDPNADDESVVFVNRNVVILDHGQMQFYDHVTGKLNPYTEESDSVVNAAYTSENMLYYTVSSKDGLMLNCLDLNQHDPKPKKIADWHLTIDRCFDDVTDMAASLMLSDDEQYVGMYVDFLWEMDYYGFKSLSVCRLDNGKVSDIEDLDYGYDHFYPDYLYDSFGNDERNFYFFDPKGNCLTDKMDLMGYLEIENEEELEEMDYSALSFSPDGNKILFNAVMPWGDFGCGPYCVSTRDGAKQWILKGSDFHDDRPQWLPDGSLVFKGAEFLKEDNPEYEDYWEGKKPCIYVMEPDGTMKVLSYAITFAAKPIAVKEDVSEIQDDDQQTESFANCEIAIFNDGKLSFYDAKERRFYSFDNETDSVINGTFGNDGKFYYCTSRKGRVFLKSLRLADPYPEEIFDMDLDLEDCISQTYGEVSPLCYYPEQTMIGMWHNFSWDVYDFMDCKLYDWEGDALIDWDHEIDLYRSYGDEDTRFEYDDFETMDGQYYYKDVCLTEKLDFAKYVEDDLDYAHDPDFWGYEANPDGTMISFNASVTSGDFEHGPICLASLDGKYQKAFEETDFCTDRYSWLSDGSFVYANGGQIMIMYPERTIATLCGGSDFVVRNK